MDNWSGVFDYGVLISLHVSRWGARKMIKLEDLGLSERGDKDQIEKLFKLGSRRMIDPKHLDKLIKIEGKARRAIVSHGVPFSAVPTAYFVADESFISLKQKLDILQEQYNNNLDEFIESYENYKEEWLDQFHEYALGELSQGEDSTLFASEFVKKLAASYPKLDSLRERFGFSYTTFTITSPADKINPEEYVDSVVQRREIQNHYQSQVKSQINGFLEQTVSGLRSELIETCEHVSGMLDDEDKRFDGRSLTAMWNRMEKFKRLNFAGDKRVTEVLNELEEYVTVDASDYRDQPQFAREFSAVLSKIGKDLRDTLEVEVKQIVTNFGDTSKRRLRLKKKNKGVKV